MMILKKLIFAVYLSLPKTFTGIPDYTIFQYCYPGIINIQAHGTQRKLVYHHKSMGITMTLSDIIYATQGADPSKMYF